MNHQIDRTERVAELIKRELAILIPRELNDTRINNVTVTAVTVSRDLKQSTVYISSMDEKAGFNKSGSADGQVRWLFAASAQSEPGITGRTSTNLQI